MADAWTLVESYLRMEDPTSIRDVGLELRLEAQVGDLTLRGIIDRLELDPDGELIVTDYKTGPGAGPEVRAVQARRRALLLVPVRVGARPPTGRHPAHVPPLG